MKIKKFLICLLLILFFPLTVSAAGSNWQTVIGYNAIDWQTYDFFVLPSAQNLSLATYQWTIDQKHTYYLPTVRYYFDPGVHQVSLQVTDELGNQYIDNVQLNVSFWSLLNNQFLWFLYAFLSLAILYYWVVKIIEWRLRCRSHHQAREFLKFFDQSKKK